MEWVDIERVRGREGGRGKKKRVGEDVMVRGTKGDGVGGRKEKREGGGRYEWIEGRKVGGGGEEGRGEEGKDGVYGHVRTTITLH